MCPDQVPLAQDGEAAVVGAPTRLALLRGRPLGRATVVELLLHVLGVAGLHRRCAWGRLEGKAMLGHHIGQDLGQQVGVA